MRAHRVVAQEKSPGQMHYPNVVSFGLPYPAPERCEHCGEPFPWAGNREKSF